MSKAENFLLLIIFIIFSFLCAGIVYLLTYDIDMAIQSVILLFIYSFLGLQVGKMDIKSN